MSGTYTIPAISTMYKGVRFRSRLEARWACFFDLLEWRWDYEPVDLNGWIPDFALHGAKTILVEVKPVFAFPQDVAKKIDEAYPSTITDYGKTSHEEITNEVLIVGAKLLNTTELNFSGSFYVDDSDTVRGVGWLRESSDWDSAFFAKYPRPANGIGFGHSSISYRDRISGAHDGDNFDIWWAGTAVQRLWREAGNTIQWQKGAIR